MKFNNPYFPGADPFLFSHGDTYYLYCTTESIDENRDDNILPCLGSDGENIIELLKVLDDIDIQYNKDFLFTSDSLNGFSEKNIFVRISGESVVCWIQKDIDETPNSGWAEEAIGNITFYIDNADEIGE